MNEYILLTDEGFTFQSGIEGDPEKVENLQVIGFAKGVNSDDAFFSLLSKNPI